MDSYHLRQTLKMVKVNQITTKTLLQENQTTFTGQVIQQTYLQVQTKQELIYNLQRLHSVDLLQLSLHHLLVELTEEFLLLVRNMVHTKLTSVMQKQ